MIEDGCAFARDISLRAACCRRTESETMKNSREEKREMTLGLDSPTPAPTNPWHGFGFCFARCHPLEDSHTWLADLRAVKNRWDLQKGLTLQSASGIAGIARKHSDCDRSAVSDSRFTAADKEPRIATVKPTDLLGATVLHRADTLAHEVEREIVAIIDEAGA